MDTVNRLSPPRVVPSLSGPALPIGTFLLRRSGSIAGWVHTGPPPYFHESPSHVSWPNSPGPERVQNFQTSLPVFASYAPNCPRTPTSPPPTPMYTRPSW